MRVHGIIKASINLNKKHRLTLDKMYELGFIGNWIRTTYPEELLVYKNDLGDNNSVTLILYSKLLDVQTSFKGLDFNSKAASQLRGSFDVVTEVICNIFYRNPEEANTGDS